MKLVVEIDLPDDRTIMQAFNMVRELCVGFVENGYPHRTASEFFDMRKNDGKDYLVLGEMADQTHLERELPLGHGSDSDQLKPMNLTSAGRIVVTKEKYLPDMLALEHKGKFVIA